MSDGHDGRSTTTTTTTPSLFTTPLLPHAVVAARRQRQLLRRRRRRLLLRFANSSDELTRRTSAGSTTAQLFQGYGTHYVDLWCGTPLPQRQTVIVDTGSAMTAFPCRFEQESSDGSGSRGVAGCTLPRNENCGADGIHHVGTLYNASQSASFATVACPDCLRKSCSQRRRRKSSNRRPCLVEQWYREGSGWEAREVRDICYLGGFHNAKRNAAAAAASASTKGGRAPTAEEEEIEPVDGLDPSTASRFAFPLQFACQTKVSGAFRTQLADGIMGMQPGVESSLWKQVLSHSQSSRRGHSGGGDGKAWERGDATEQEAPAPWMERGAFSLCFSFSPLIRSERLARRGASAGLLTLGGADPRLNTETDMVYTRSGAPSRDRYFGVEIRHMYLLSPTNATTSSTSRSRPPKVLRLEVSEYDLNRYQVIVDSGSTNTYLTSKAREPFERAWKQLVGSHLDLDAKFDSMESLPTIVFQLKGVWGLNRAILREQQHSESPSLLVGATNNPLGSSAIDPDHPHDVIIALPPSQYCEWDVRRRGCRLSLDFDSHEDSALGASTLLNYHVLFDADNNRLGWARSSCNYTAIVGSEFDIGRTAAHRGKKARDSSKGDVEASDVRYDHDEAHDAHSTKENAINVLSALNVTDENLSATSNSTVQTPLNQSLESSSQYHRVSDAATVSGPFVQPWWVVSGLFLALLAILWRARRRRPSGGGRQRRDEDRAPLLRKS
jgi:hypothetical protein